MKVSARISVVCGGLLAAGATQAVLRADEDPVGRVEFAEGLEPAWIPAVSTEDLHAPEATSVLPLLSDYEAFVVRLLLTKGHLRAGVEAYKTGYVNHALAHLGQPVDVLHEDLDRWLRVPGAEPFEIALDALVAGVRENASPELADRELASTLAAIDQALQKLDIDIRESPTFVMLVIISVMRAAIEEYQLGVANGQITDLIEYQDARAFIAEAEAYAEASPSLRARNAGAYGILMAEFAALKAAMPPAERWNSPLIKPGELQRAIARLAILFESFK